MGAVDFNIYGGTNSITGKQSQLSINTIVAIKGKLTDKAMKHYNRVPLSNKTLFRRDQNLCGYCGREFSSSRLTRDHIQPTSKEGKNIWMNVITACAGCNKVKGDNTPEEAHMPLLFIPYIPNRSEWLILQNRKILTDQMDFLIKKVPKDSRLL
jgi:CRISPR/Cas system Type II protein with McrA/HNH and RuvC-like nuclease domain